MPPPLLGGTAGLPGLPGAGLPGGGLPGSGLPGGGLPGVLPGAGLPAMGGQAMTQQATRHARRVYVGGLPLTATDQTIAQFFSSAMHAIGGIVGTGDPVVNVYINGEKKFAFVVRAALSFFSFRCCSLLFRMRCALLLRTRNGDERRWNDRDFDLVCLFHLRRNSAL